MSHLRLGFFTEIYRPVVNGVVTSVDGLAQGLRSRGHEVYCFAPSMPGGTPSDGAVFRMPSLPLPTATPYRLTLPLVSRRNVNNVIKRLASDPRAFALRYRLGWVAIRSALRYADRLHVSHAARSLRALRSVRAECDAFCSGPADADILQLGGCCRRARPRMSHGIFAISESRRASRSFPRGSTSSASAPGMRDDRLRRRFGVPADGRLVLFVSRLAREKNVDVLFAALADANDPVTEAGHRRRWTGARGARTACGRSATLRSRRVSRGRRTRAASRSLRQRRCVRLSEHDRNARTGPSRGAGRPERSVIAADTPPNREVLGDAARIVAPNRGRIRGCAAPIPAAPTRLPPSPREMAASRFVSGSCRSMP